MREVKFRGEEKKKTRTILYTRGKNGRGTWDNEKISYLREAG